MSEPIGWIIGVSSALTASLLAAADGALLALQTAHGRDGVAASVRVDRERTHRTLSLGRVIAYVAAGAAFAQALHIATRPTAVAVVVALVSAMAVVTLAEGTARELGYALPDRTLALTQPVVRAATIVLAPLATLGAAMERSLNRMLPPQPTNALERETSAEQFHEVVAAEADVSIAEEALIHGVFSMGSTEVQEVMVPRVDVVGIAATTPWSEALDRIRSAEHARFPIYDDTLDDIVGILYAKDLLGAIVADEEPAGGWRALVRPADFIPTSKPINAQLRDFQAGRTHIAIVSDEFGGTAGLVTIEDILEEIVGEIRDEYDVEEADIMQEGTTRFWVAGRVPLSELSERLEADFEVEDVTTVGGLVYELFGRVPKAGESITSNGYHIVVERVRRRRVERVYFKRLEAAKSSELA
jgi:magnesium and cobalt exporter, CNNM family